MVTSIPARPILHPIRPAPLLDRALTGMGLFRSGECPFAGIACFVEAASRPAPGIASSAIRFDIANLDDIATLAGAAAAAHATAMVAQRLDAGIAGAHRPLRSGDRCLLVAAPLDLEAAVELARRAIEALSLPIVFDTISIRVSIAATIGQRPGTRSPLAAAA